MGSITSAIVLTLTGALGSSGLSAPEPPDFSYVLENIKPTHPRIFLNQEILQRVKREGLTPEQQEWLALLKERVDGYPTPPPMDEKLVAHMLSDAGGVRYTPRSAARVVAGDWGHYASHAALVFLLTGEQRYLNRSVEFLTHAAGVWEVVQKNGRICQERAYVRLAALSAYDWLYNDLTPEQRKGIGHSLFASLYPWYQATQGRGSGQIYYGDELMGWYLGLVFQGTGVENADDATCTQLLRGAYDQYVSLFRARTAEPDGVALSGAFGYTTQFLSAEITFLDSWRSAIGGNFARHFPKRAYFGNYSLWNTIFSKPRLLEFGWSDPYHINNFLDTMHHPYLMRVGDLYADMGDQIEVEALAAIAQYQTPRSYERFLDFSSCYLTPASPLLMSASAPSREKVQAVLARLARARHFPDPIGHIFMNSGRGENDTYALFIAGRKSSIRKHYDENHFTIYKKGFLALDSGARGFSVSRKTGHSLDPEHVGIDHEINYYYDTLAHNSVLIYMEGEKLPGHWGQESDINTGGMNKDYGAQVKAFETNDRFTYIASDATPCYNEAKAQEVVRQFLFVNPDYFVVFDRVASKAPSQKKTWLMHTQCEPQVQGDTFSAEHREGKMFVRTLLPAAAHAEKIGGPGKEFWAGGRNWPVRPDWQHLLLTPDQHLFGCWRMEITSAQENARELFLHLIQVGDRQELKEMTPSRLVDEGQQVGVEIQAGKATVRVLFNRDGDVGGRIRITEGGQTVLDRPLTQQVQEQRGLALNPR